jgi:DNA (cytosine-5)-methyltransferase 1
MDPRNALFRHYLAAVRLIRPRFILIENVRGITLAFRKERSTGRPGARPYSEVMTASLARLGYTIFSGMVRAVDFGIPQQRHRFIMIGVRNDYVPEQLTEDPFALLEDVRNEFLKSKTLPPRPITVREAISDLSRGRRVLQVSVDSPGFHQIQYLGPRTGYQRLLHGDLNGQAPNSLRLARHRPDIERRFAQILMSCRRGVHLSDEDRRRFGISKHVTVPLDPNLPSHTLTTLPDDLLHYSEPRILTVRECARLQSFPDWFAFYGKYTTGGKQRTQECPRYTQVGNAVPPFLAEALGQLLLKFSSRIAVTLAALPLLAWRGQDGP